MSALDREIDRLYQLPLTDFTRARDDLAKGSESDRAAIRRLQKPNLAAWAVNQLFWQDRGLYAALISAAERVRRAQVNALGGKPTDVPKTEAEHAAAKRSAQDRIQTILGDAGENATAATLRAISETLDALPSVEPPGRLTRPLRPMGFEGLAGLLKGKPVAARAAQVLPFRSTPGRSAADSGASVNAEASRAKQAARLAKREAERQRQAARELARQIREAEAAERDVSRKLASARTDLEKAEHGRKRLAEQLDEASQRIDRLRRQAEELERAAATATRVREQLQRS
jgi:hypothetical protein